MLYNRIREICIKKGISIGSLEREAGLSNGTVGKWNISRPNIDSITAVSNVLNIPVEKLLDDTTNTVPK